MKMRKMFGNAYTAELFSSKYRKKGALSQIDTGKMPLYSSFVDVENMIYDFSQFAASNLAFLNRRDENCKNAVFKREIKSACNTSAERFWGVNLALNLSKQNSNRASLKLAEFSPRIQLIWRLSCGKIKNGDFDNLKEFQ